MTNVIPFDSTFVGSVPVGYDIVVYEAGADPLEEGYVLYGFDEVDDGFFADEFKNPVYAFVK